VRNRRVVRGVVGFIVAALVNMPTPEWDDDIFSAMRAL
jgi:hypothetical protein